MAYEYGYPSAPRLFRSRDGEYMAGLASLFMGEYCTIDKQEHLWEAVSPGVVRCTTCYIYRTDKAKEK
jgi:hypothetical protein